MFGAVLVGRSPLTLAVSVPVHVALHEERLVVTVAKKSGVVVDGDRNAQGLLAGTQMGLDPTGRIRRPIRPDYSETCHIQQDTT